MIDPELLAEAAEETKPVPTDTALEGIATLARKQQRLEKEVEDAKKKLADLEKDLARVAELDLPDALAAVGMTEFTLSNGYRVTVKDEVYGNIPSADSENPELLDRRDEVFEYLRKTGNDALIRHEIKVSTGKGDDATAAKAMKALRDAGVLYADSKTIHSSTLKAFLKEQILEKHTPGFPEKAFGVHRKKVATIRMPRSKK